MVLTQSADVLCVLGEWLFGRAKNDFAAVGSATEFDFGLENPIETRRRGDSIDARKTNFFGQGLRLSDWR